MAPIETRVIHRGAKFDYVESSWSGRDGRRLTRQFVRHPGSVVILPLIEEGGQTTGMVWIRNFRHALGRAIWELPAGTRDRAEAVEACAARELIEETGYEAGRLERVGVLHTGPGMTDEAMEVFVARGLREVGVRPEEDEEMTVHPMGLVEVWGMVERGEVTDSKSLAVLMLGWRRGVMG